MFGGFISMGLGMLLFLCLMVSTGVSLLFGLCVWTRKSVYRIALNLLFFALFFPVVHLGNFLNLQLFLMKLPRYQEATNLILKDVKSKSQRLEFVVALPQGYSDLNTTGKASVVLDPNDVATVLYFKPGSSAVGHSGYLYRSDDNLEALKRECPELGFYRVAPNWYTFAD
jgi:hypothetical protein